MATLFHFQINPDKERKDWDSIKAHSKPLNDRVAAVHFAKRLARILKAEVRLTTGADPGRTSGAYFHHKQQ